MRTPPFVTITAVSILSLRRHKVDSICRGNKTETVFVWSKVGATWDGGKATEDKLIPATCCHYDVDSLHPVAICEYSFFRDLSTHYYQTRARPAQPHLLLLPLLPHLRPSSPMPASSPGASVAHLPAMAVYGPLTRPLPTVLQPVDSLSGKHLSASPVSTDSSVHNSLESWFHVSSSSSNSSFSVHPSVPPLPKGARAPSPQPSSSRIAQHTHAATLPSLVSPAPSPSGSRQACHSLSWSFEWRGISKIVKWASTSQSEKSPDNVQPSRPPSPRFPESTAVIGIYKDAEARHYAPKNFPGAHVHEDLDASEPPASFANSSSRVDLAEGRYNCSQSEHGHSARSHHLNADVGLNFPSISEVHLPRGSKGGRRPQQPYLQIVSPYKRDTLLHLRAL
jgi:hypothetical protein